MWDKLCLSYEKNFEQGLEHLYPELEECKKEPSDSAAMHVSKRQKLWLELHEESFKIHHIRLPDKLLMRCILSMMPSEYLDFPMT